MTMLSQKFNVILQAVVAGAVLFALGCGGGKVKSLSDLQAASTMKVELSTGSGQTIAPGSAFATVKFRILDATGKPMARTPVSMRLFDVTGVDGVTNAEAGEPTAAMVLKQAWAARERSIAVDKTDTEAAIPDEQLLGLLLNHSEATDGAGDVEATVQACQRPGRSIALVAGIDGNAPGDLAGGMGWVILRTKSLGESVSSDVLTIVVNNGQEVVAGKAFPIALRVEGADAAARYNDPSRLVSFDLALEAKNKLDTGSTKPPEAFSCAFVNGECLLPEGPFVLLTEGAVTLKVAAHDAGFPLKPATAVFDVAPFQRYEALDLEINHGLAVIAGKPFDATLHIRSSDAATYEGKEGSFEISVEAENGLGKDSISFPGILSCKIVDGSCAIEGGPFVFATTGLVTVKVRSLSPVFPFQPLTKAVEVEAEERFESVSLLVNDDQPVVVGQDFSLAVKVSGRDVRAYDGKTLSFEMTYSTDLTLTAASTMPPQAFSCRFEDGKCGVPGGPFRIEEPGFVTFQLVSTSDELSFAPLVQLVQVNEAPSFESLMLVVNNDQTVVRGRPFDIEVRLLGKNTAEKYDGLAVDFLLTTQTDAAQGGLAKRPPASFRCTIAEGRCGVSGGPFTFDVAGFVTFTLVSSSAQLPLQPVVKVIKVEDAPVVAAMDLLVNDGQPVIRGKPFSLRVLLSGADALTYEGKTAAFKLETASTSAFGAGSVLPPVDFECTIEESRCEVPNGPFNFEMSGDVNLTLVTTRSAFSFPTVVKLVHVSEEPSFESLVLVVNGDNTVVRGKELGYKLIIAGKDASTKYAGRTATFRFDYSFEQGGAGAGTVVPPAQVTCTFVDAECEVSGGPFVFGQAGFVTISVVTDTIGFNFVPLTKIVHVLDPAPTSMVLSYTPHDQGIAPVCPIGMSPKDVANPCMRFSADLADIKIYPILLDQAGDALSGSASTWQIISGPLVGAGRLEGISVPVFQTIHPEKTGKGQLTVTAGSFTFTSYYEVVAGAPVRYFPVTQHNQVEVATEPFQVFVDLFDKHDNLCDNYDETVTLTVGLRGVSASPSGQAPVAEIINSTLISAGRATIGSLSTSVVNGQTVSTVVGGLWAPRAGEAPVLTVSGPLGTFDGGMVVVNHGPFSAVKIRSAPAGGGIEFTAPMVISISDSRAIYVAGYDVLGNFTDDIPSTFAGTGVVAYTRSGVVEYKLSGTAGSAVTFLPGKDNTGEVGTGKITITPDDPNVAAIETPLITVISADATRLAIATEHQNFEPAGVPFRIYVHALDSQGVVASAFNGTFTLTFNVSELPSWGGDHSVLPTGDVACEFVNGICEVPGSYVVTNVAFPPIISAQEASGSIADLWAAFITPVAGAPTRLLVVDRPGGPAAGARPATSLANFFSSKIELTSDDTLSLSAALVDEGGNYIADAPASTAWIGAATPAEAIDSSTFSSSVGTTVVFAGGKVGEGTITASLAGYTPASSPAIRVAHGALHHVRVLETANGTNVLDPGSCYPFSITLEDEDHNKITSYNTTANVTLTWLTASSGVAVYAPPRIVESGNAYSNTWTGVMGILGGEVSTQGMQLCLYDGTNVTPKLQVSLPAKDGFPALTSVGDAAHAPSDTFAIAVGAPDHIAYSRTSGEAGQYFCTPAWFNSCANFNVDNGPVTLYAHLMDRGGNFIRTVAGNWSSTSAVILAEMVATPNSEYAQLTNHTAVSSLQAVTFTPTDGAPFTGSQRFVISPGVPTHATLSVNGGVPVSAVSPWYVTVYTRDQYENLSAPAAPRSISFTFDGTATASPKGTSPVLAANVASYSFPSSYYQSPTTFLTPRSNQSPTLRVSVSGFPDVTATFAVNPGAPVKAAIYDVPAITGSPIGALNILSTASVNMYGCALDGEDNFSACGISGTWTGSNELAGRLTPSAGSTTQLNPYLVTTTAGYGVVTFTPVGGSILAATTGNIVVSNAPLAGFTVSRTSGGSTVSAGTPFTLNLRAVDVNGNAVTQFDGAYYINWSSTTYAQTSEGWGVSLPPSGYYNFVDGNCTDTLTATFYNAQATPRIDVTYNNGSTNFFGNTWPFGGFTVQPGSVHHYGTRINTVGNVAQAYSDRSATFPTSVESRDAYGNVVCCGESNVTISMMNTNGTAANGTLAGTLTVDLSATSTVNLSNHAYDIGGQRKLKASSSGFATPTTAAETITFQTSRSTVHHYSIVPVATVTAGVGYPFQVRAIDNANGVITGADADLSLLTFSWSGPSVAPNGSTPLLPASLTFIAGSASPTLTLYNAETIAAASLSIADDQTPSKSGTATGNVTVQAGPLTQYHITANQTTRTADSSGTFNVNIAAYDSWENPRSGDGSVTLLPVRVSGVANVGSFAGPATSAVNLGTGNVTLSNVWYDVPHTISFGLSGTAATVSQASQIVFTPTIHTVKSYGLTLPTSITVGGSNLAVTVRALDGGSNVINDAAVDAALNAQSYCWSGPGTSPSPAFQAPSLQTAPSFSAGIATFTHSLYKAETLAINALVFQDNYSGSCSSLRQGRNAAALAVNPATAVSYDLVNLSSLATTAGVGFNMRVRALDPYSNVDTNWTSDHLEFSWSGTTATPATPNSAGGVTATVFSQAGNQAFSAGIFNTTTNPFKLYRAVDAAPVLSVSGTGLPGPFTKAGFTTSPSATVNFVKIHDVGSTGLSHSTEIGAWSMTTDQTKQLWAHGYDFWGNYISLQSVTWSSTGALGTGDVPVGPANTSTVDPHTIGSGVITATHASATADSTGTVTVNPGVITKLAFAQSPVVQASTACATLDVQSKDARNNLSPQAANATILLTSTAGTGSFHTNASCSDPITQTTISAGTATARVYYKDTLVGSKTLVASESPSSGWTDATLGVTITPGVITQVAFTTAALSQTSGTCGTVSFATQDVYGNASPVGAGTSFTLGTSFGSGTFYSGSSCTGAITQASIASGASSATVYYSDSSVGQPTLTVDESPSAGWSAATQLVSINPGSFTVTGPSTPTSVSPPTVTWTASAGTPNYQLKVATASSCASPQQQYASLSGTSKLLSTIPDGSYYVCLTALGNGASDVAATNSGSYAFTVDATAPVAASSLITPADAAGGADVRYDDDTAVYFAWGASTDATSGVKHYIVHWYSQAACGGTATQTGTLTSTNYNLTGLTHNTTYSYKVQTFDNANNSVLSACSPNIKVDTVVPVGATGLITAADAVGGGNATSDNDTSIYFVWTAGSDAATAVRDYTVSYYTQAACGGTATNVTGVTAANYNLTTASTNTTYSFKVTTYDMAGNSTVSACSGNIFVDATAPVAASGLITAADAAAGPDVRYDNDTTIYFAWSAATDVGGSGIASYTLKRYSAAACGGAAVDTTGLSPSTLSQSFTGAGGSTYSFRIQAYDAVGLSTTSACSGNMTIDTTAPTTAASSLIFAQDAVGGASANYDNDLQVFMKWTAAADNGGGSGIVNYTLSWYGQAACGGTATDVTGVTGTSYTFNAAAVGTYSFKLTAYDNAGNAGAVSACSSNMLIDMTAPTLATGLVTAADATNGPDVRYDNDTTVYFVWTPGTDASAGVASQTLNRYALTACGGAATATTGLSAATANQSFTGVNGTVYSFRILTYDNSGNVSTSACSGDIRIDTTAPVAASTLKTAADSTGGADVRYDDDTTVYFVWTAATDTGGSGIASYTLQRFDQAACGGASTDTTGISSATTNQSFTGVTGTTYSFKVLAYDNAGNMTASSCSGNMTIDTVAPTTPASALFLSADAAGGAQTSYDNETAVFLNWTAAADNVGGSGIASYTINRYALTACGGSATQVATGVTGASYAATLPALNTTYSFKIIAVDQAGLQSAASSCSNDIMADSTAPTAASTLKTAADAAGGVDVRYDDDTTVYFAWAAATDAASGVASYTLQRYDLAACGGTATSTSGLSAATLSQSFTGVNGSTYSFKVVAYDNSGNSSTSACSGNILIDTTLPVAPATLTTAADSAGGADARYDNDTGIYFAWTAGSDAGGSGVASYTLSRYGQTACGGASTDTTGLSSATSSQSFTGVNGTTYSFKVTVYDNAGNASTSACSGDMTIDTTAPGAFSISAPTNSSTILDNTPTVAWGASTGASSYTVTVGSAASCGSAVQTHGSVAGTSQTLTTLADGVWHVCVTAVDQAGNSTTATNNDVTVTVSTGSWAATTATGAPAARRDATAVWDSGSGVMVVWGGYDGSGVKAAGGRYDPTGDSWSAVTTTAEPAARRGHTAVWTGSRMLVWGGYDGAGTRFQSGGSYDPSGNAWSTTDTSDADTPTARYGHSAVWDSANARMIVWGGFDTAYRADGAALDPASGGPDHWAPVDAADVDRPSARSEHGAVWTGSKMIVWGGYNGSALADGAVYDPACPAGDCWTPISSTNAPSARFRHSAVWTGSKMLVFGGYDGTSYLGNGALYDPATDTWVTVAATDAPSVRASHVGVWDSSSAVPQLIVFGGHGGSYLGDGAIFRPSASAWSVPALNASAAPAARAGAAAVWTGTKAVVWGGYDGASYLQSGGRYTPP